MQELPAAKEAVRCMIEKCVHGLPLTLIGRTTYMCFVQEMGLEMRVYDTCIEQG